MMKMIFSSCALLFAFSAQAEVVTVQSDVHYRLSGAVPVTEAQALPKLKELFAKDLNAYCGQENAYPSLKSSSVLNFKLFVSKSCPVETSQGGFVMSSMKCEESKKIASTLVRAKVAAKIECVADASVKTSVSLHRTQHLNSHQAIQDDFGRFLINVFHGTGCGKHYMFVSKRISCADVKVPAHQKLKIEKADSCAKLEFFTDNACEAGTSSTANLEPADLVRDGADPWDRVILVNSENVPFLTNGFAELQLLPIHPPQQ